jgi:uncharacterized protein
VKRGYAYVVQNERGHFFSEGNYDILGAPITDGYDAVDWMTRQPWSNGKVGTTGCSSTAEWQMAVASLGHPALAAMNVQGFGAGVGRVGPYYEQGNWYRGGAIQMLFIAWLYGEQNQVRPMFPMETSREDLVAASRLFDLAPQMPPVDWAQGAVAPAGAGHPEGGDGRAASSPTRCRCPRAARWCGARRTIPAWYKGGLWHDDMPLNVPGLWFMSWYDVSVGRTSRCSTTCGRPRSRRSPTSSGPSSRPSRTARSPAPPRHRWSASAAWATRGSTTQRSSTASSTVPQGREPHALDTLPKVTYFTMGSNGGSRPRRGRPPGPADDVLPVERRQGQLALRRRRAGDGAAGRDAPDAFTYDPLNPVPSYGGNVCCTGNAIDGGLVRPAPHGGAQTCWSTPPNRSRRASS